LTETQALLCHQVNNRSCSVHKHIHLSTPMQAKSHVIEVAIVGAGPAGLMAAEVLSGLGHEVHMMDAMPSVGRKFLLAGRGGLNLTHAEDFEKFVKRFGAANPYLMAPLTAWGPDAICQWAQGLGVDTFVGTSGRVFPKEMKAAPLLRAWLKRLRHPTSGVPVQLHMRHRLSGIEALAQGHDSQASVALSFDVTDLSNPLPQQQTFLAKSVVLALGGGSWARLGSDGKWVHWLQAKGVTISPLQAANCGFHVAGREGQGWTPYFKDKFAGHPLKSIAISWTDASGHKQQKQGEFVTTHYGVEGSLVYAASADLRESVNAHGSAELTLDLLPDKTLAHVLQEVSHPRGSRSMASHLKSRLGLQGVKMGLLHELLAPDLWQSPTSLAKAIKFLGLQLNATRPIDEAISTAGGVAFEGLDAAFQIKALPGVFCAGEMLDWEAPTGGYLLTACMATGRQAAMGVHQMLNVDMGQQSAIKGDEP
jgi:uncharacterized flavoprotein (TIGR03862 family)